MQQTTRRRTSPAPPHNRSSGVGRRLGRLLGLHGDDHERRQHDHGRHGRDLAARRRGDALQRLLQEPGELHRQVRPCPYTGSLASSVRFYVSSGITNGTAFNLQVERGSVSPRLTRR